MQNRLLQLSFTVIVILGSAGMVVSEEPPAIKPFEPSAAQREDAIPGYVELSDGSIHPGQIYLTRDKRLVILDNELQRQREIPLSAVKQIQCTVKKEWMEKEWKFEEAAKDTKLYTGRSYPVRQYEHTITLNDGRTITGGLSAIIYVQAVDHTGAKPESSQPEPKVEQFILNKRNKGKMGEDLKSLIYVKTVKLGKEAYDEGKQKVVKYKMKDDKKD